MMAIGGKAQGLARLGAVEGIRIPRTVVIGAAAAQRVMAALLPRRATRFSAAALAERLAQHKVIRQWAKEAGRALPKAPLLIVRSSALVEDGAARSYAGHFESIVSPRNARSLGSAMAQVLSSMMRVLHATGGMTPREASAQCALVVQPMLHPEKAGVLFTRAPVVRGGAGASAVPQMITAAWGTGTGVVDGTIATDTLSIHDAGADTMRVEHNLAYQFDMVVPDLRAATRLIGAPIKTSLGDTKCLGRYGPFLSRAKTPAVLAGHCALAPHELSALLDAGDSVRRAFGHHVDIEWAIDEGDLFIVQARPITRAAQAIAAPLTSGYAVASGGRGEGPARRVPDIAHLDTVQKGDVLLVGATDPAFLPALEKAAAIISEEGSPLCHTAIVARELGVPCLLGVKGVLGGRYVTGQWLRVDGERGTISVGRAQAKPSLAKKSTRGRAGPSPLTTYDAGHRARAARQGIWASALLDAFSQAAPDFEHDAEVALSFFAQQEIEALGRAVRWDIAEDDPAPSVQALHALLGRGA